MKKILFCLLCLLAIVCAAGCSAQNEEPAPIPDLIGGWERVDSNPDGFCHIATVTDTAIEIFWYAEDEDTYALYWSGSFEPPTTADEPYTWVSANNTEETSSALLASTAETKEFTYENGQISYEVSAMGVTQIVKLERLK